MPNPNRNNRFIPRPYQENAIHQVLALHNRGTRKMLLHLPTGSGKTVIATLIIERLMPWINQGKILFIAHRKELLDQIAQKVQQQMPRLKTSFEQGPRLADQSSQLVIASIQSLIHRKDVYRPELFSLIICDECHHALAPSWQEVLEYFHENRRQDALLLGMTATPRRTDGRSALRVFDTVAYAISRPELQDLGYLVPIQYWAVKAKLGLDKVKISGGDFQVGSLSKVMNTPQARALTFNAWQSKANTKKTLVFCASVQHAYQLAADFTAQGLQVEVLEGRTKNRDEILDRFRHGHIQLLFNYGVLTEGFDDPGIECVLLARPTTSPLVYNQCLGRGLRPAENKSNCTVIDIIDRSTHQLQYGANQMANLSPKWRSQGRDPWRDARSISQVRVSDPDVFMEIKQAQSLEEIQDILMALPPDVVTAGLDGEPVPVYKVPDTPLDEKKASRQIRTLLRKAGAAFKDLRFIPASSADEPSLVWITFIAPAVNNERFEYLVWHLERATGWNVGFVPAPMKKKYKRNPKSLLKSMLPNNHRFSVYEYHPQENRIVAEVMGLQGDLLEQIRSTFESTTGIKLDLQGQLSFGF